MTTVRGRLEGLRINDVKVAPLIEAELDRRHPEHGQAARDRTGPAAGGGCAVEEGWAVTLAHAGTLPEPMLHQQVDGDFSFVETLRHLIFATDCRLFRAIRRVAWAWIPKPAPALHTNPQRGVVAPALRGGGPRRGAQ